MRDQVDVDIKRARDRHLVRRGIRQGTLLGRKEQLLKAAYYEELRNQSKVVNYLSRRILEAAGKKVSRNLVFFDVTHNLDLPVSPKIETTLNPAGNNNDNDNGKDRGNDKDKDKDFAITLQSAQLARSVYVSFGDLDVETSDNYFDLLPGEPVKVKLKAPQSISLDQLKNSMQVISLTDAFPAAPTMH